MTSQAVIGIDVSKRTLDVHIHGEAEVRKFANDLVTYLQPRQPALIALEATGGHERRAATALRQAGWRVAVAQPAPNGQLRACITPNPDWQVRAEIIASRLQP